MSHDLKIFLAGAAMGALIVLAWIWEPMPKNDLPDYTVYEQQIAKHKDRADAAEQVNAANQKYYDSLLATIGKERIIIKHHYEKIYASLDSLTLDSALRLRSGLRGQFRNKYR